MNGGTIMTASMMYRILSEMSEELSASQIKRLQEVLFSEMESKSEQVEPRDNLDFLHEFLVAKEIEGCSKRTIDYYQYTIGGMLKVVNISIAQIETEHIRNYLSEYQKKNDCSKTTVDNIRRNLSSFFAWLEEENYILKSPVRRIHKIKTPKLVKEVIPDEELEILRDGCVSIRDLAMIELLMSTGIRVGELVNLRIRDIDFNERECIVHGKGDKERKAYFNAKTKLHLQEYVKKRRDGREWLFVSLKYPYEHLTINGIESRNRNIGKKCNVENVYPHKFRRTMATRAIDKGMPIEQVQQLLGHQQIDTTMHYAMVNQSNVKNSHRKYIS
ncbi:MAG: Site-specific recombinase XerD [Eubacterium sp.]|jgi:integrase/recombinase XerD|nr:Site-specific recombinase XerD [Eubacterium sp.]